MKRVLAVDPPGCGCTECIIGEYIPLDQAEAQHVVGMLCGRIQNNTGHDIGVTVDYVVEEMFEFTIDWIQSATATINGHQWDVTLWWNIISSGQKV